MTRFTALALVLALAPHASAQVRIGAAAESGSVPAIAPAGINTAPGSIQPGLTLPSASLSLSVAPSIAPAPAAIESARITAAQAISPAMAIAPAAAPVLAVKGVAVEARGTVSGHSEIASGDNSSQTISPRPTTRAARASVLIQDEVASWGPSRRTQDVVVEGGRRFAALEPLKAAASASERNGSDVPVPPAKSPAPNGAPRLTKALVVSGFAMIGVTVVSVAMPALLPAAVVAYKGAFAWVGLATLTASRFTKTSEAAPDVPRGPPSDGKGMFGSFKGAWVAAKDSANAQASFEKRVGNFSWQNFRDWALGALRTGTIWMGPALLAMLGGAAAAKGVLMLGAKAAVAAAPAAAATDLTGLSMGAVMGNFLPMALAAEAAGLVVFFVIEKLAQKLGAEKAATWIGALAALGVAAAGVLSMTTAPFVVISTLALEAGVIWTAARSRSFASAMALRGILTAFSLSAAVLASWLNFGVAGALVGLPAVWGGVIVGGLALLAWKLKSPGLQLKDIREWWNKEEPGQRPKNPWRILSSGLTWGLVVYAIGDLTFWGVNALAPGHEPAPAILAKMLTAPVILVLYNFVLVGLLEEFIFRRGLFNWINGKLDKIKALTANKAFWTAAIASALIFSGVHYIDWGAVLAKIGMGDPAASSGLGGAYDFSWAGFVARSVLGVVLAWLYKRSGLLLIPIVAHFWADSMEGLGLRWGFPAFIALAAGAMIVSFLFRPKSKPS